MRTVKRTTQLCIQKPTLPLAGDLCPPWEGHPSWMIGLEELTAYHRWVNDVVMPIAFQWIEENYDEVYASVDPTYKDDVGAVLASAFDLVKALPNYADGLAATDQYEEDVKNGTLDPSTLNPAWTKIVDKVRKCRHHAFEEQAGVLKDTILATKPK